MTPKIEDPDQFLRDYEALEKNTAYQYLLGTMRAKQLEVVKSLLSLDTQAGSHGKLELLDDLIGGMPIINPTQKGLLERAHDQTVQRKRKMDGTAPPDDVIEEPQGI